MEKNFMDLAPVVQCFVVAGVTLVAIAVLLNLSGFFDKRGQ